MKKNSHFFLKLFIFLFLLSPFFYSWIEGQFLNSNTKNDNQVLSSDSLESSKIINGHEHMESLEQVADYLKASRGAGIIKTVLLGSPHSTFHGEPTGFQGEEENNEELLKIYQMYPEELLVFPAIDPEDPNKLIKLKDYLSRGAKGLKLYSGDHRLHDLSLDDSTMLPVYRFCQENKIPVMFHVNAGYYLEEFENVLKLYPDLKIICPHFCLSTIASDRLEYLMDSYPQLYTDISFGNLIFLKEAVMRISRDPDKYRRLVDKYQDRILFGTDMVISEIDFKTEAWMSGMIKSYRDMLEKDVYTFFALKGHVLRGLFLSKEILNKIYFLNFEKLMAETV